MHDLTLKEEAQEIITLQDLAYLALDFASKASSANTRRTYQYGWKSFYNWCTQKNIDPLSSQEKKRFWLFIYLKRQLKGI